VSPPITDYLPHRPPFLFVDEIIAETENSLTARLRVKPEFDFFRGHYPGNPIMPGVLVSEAVFQAGCVLLTRIVQRETSAGGSVPKGTPVLARIENARFRNAVRPGDELTIDVKLKERVSGFVFMSGAVKCAARRVMNVDFCVTLGEGEESTSPR
jgi:3-hydroxyacyl-[acyl-carrier-protein] dehydratase